MTAAPATLATFKEELTRLVAHFSSQHPYFTGPDYNEAKLREDFLNPFLAALGWDVVPSHANFILADAHQDGRALFQALMQKGVIVRPADGWGYSTHVRVSVGLPDMNRRFLAALRECLTQ
jgi:histidinol-phosphate/aromatic aminotransferase/cobyric acid decarboxylase-like protein